VVGVGFIYVRRYVQRFIAKLKIRFKSRATSLIADLRKQLLGVQRYVN
jgi:hypothetical protein